MLKIKDTTGHTFFVSPDVEYNLIAFMQFAGVCPQGNRQIDFTVETFDVIIPVMIAKSRIAYLYDDFTIRQGLEKMRNRGYTAIPVITRDGRYVGTVSEGDFLWRLLSDGTDLTMKKAESLRVCDIIGNKYPAVRITVTMDALLESAMNQNFIPVVDDLDKFIGIVTRRDIIGYLAKKETAALDRLPSKIS